MLRVLPVVGLPIGGSTLIFRLFPSQWAAVTGAMPRLVFRVLCCQITMGCRGTETWCPASMCLAAEFPWPSTLNCYESLGIFIGGGEPRIHVR